MDKSIVARIDGIAAEYVLAPKMVIFSHGFGVRRDTSGFFTEIIRSLPTGYGYVLFDYNKYDDSTNTVLLSDFTQQIDMLRRVLKWTSEQLIVEETNVVAHSMGCIVTGLLKPDRMNSVIMLAPPMSIGENTRNFFTNRDGARQEDEYWVVPRTDGTTSKIPTSMFDEFESINAAEAIIEYAESHSLHVITAAEDEVLPDEDYEKFVMHPNIEIVAVKGANHNFAGDARQKVIRLIQEKL